MIDPAADRFARTRALYGEDSFARIRQGGAVVVGLGGVGAHCTVSLARSGIGRLLLIDFDVVTPSSLNRLPEVAPRDVGRRKTEVYEDWVHAVCPDTQVETRAAFVGDDTRDALLPATLPARYGVLVDAIDALNPKVGLLVHAKACGWTVVSSMGAAAKRDPGLVRVGDIAQTSVCPLARAVRVRLKRRGIARGVTCVYSLEAAAAPLPPEADGEDLARRRGRVRNLQPSNMSLPGIFGFALAAAVLDRLAGPDRS